MVSSRTKRHISKVHIGVLAAVFLTLLTTVSVVAFNAFALPEDYVYVSGKGIYLFRDSYDSRGDVSRIEIITDDNDLMAVSSSDLATYAEYPSLQFSIKQIEAYVDDVCVAKTDETTCVMDLSELGRIRFADYAVLDRYFDNGYISGLRDLNSGTTYYWEANFRAAYDPDNTKSIYFKFIGTDDTSFNCSTLKFNDVYNALREFKGLTDAPTYQPSYYKEYGSDNVEVLASFDLKNSTAVSNLAFYMGDVKIPVRQDENGYYKCPSYRIVYADGNESVNTGYYYEFNVCSDENRIFVFGPYSSNTTTVTPNGENKILDSITIENYNYGTTIPALLTFKYDLGEGVTDNNVPTLEEDSRIDAVTTDYLGNTGSGNYVTVKVDDGKNLVNGQNHLDKWMFGSDADSVGANPGESIPLVYYNENTYEYSLLPGAVYEGFDDETGLFHYSYTITPTWRDYTKLKYDINLDDSARRYYAEDQNGNYYNSDADAFYDSGEYSATVPATVNDAIYTCSNSIYTFVGWSKDVVPPLLKKTDAGYIDANDNTYTDASFLHSGDSVDMAEDHTLYAVWRISDDYTDDFVKVKATISGGVFVPTITTNYGGTYNSSSWLTPTGGFTFVQKVSYSDDLVFASVPNDGNNAFVVSYELGEYTYAGNVNDPEFVSYGGYASSFYGPDFSNADSSKTYYYHIEYLKFGSYSIDFFKNEPDNDSIYDTDYAYVNDLYVDTQYNLGEMTVKNADGSVTIKDCKVWYEDIQAYKVESVTFTVSGYEFAGWAEITEDEDYNPVYDPTQLLETVKFTEDDNEYMELAAVWKLPEVIYYSDTDKATVIDTQSVTIGSETTVGLTSGVAEPTKDGCTFDGWTCVTNGITVTDGKFIMPSTTVEFVPNWKSNSYKVTYSVTGAPAGYTAPAEQTVAVGTEVTVEAVPSITGYDFAGWTTTDATVADGKFTMPDNAVTFAGTFTVKKYDVIYYTDTDKATVLDTQNKDYNTEVTVGLTSGVAEPTKAGCTFKGWTTTDVTVTDGKFTMPSTTVEFVPVWEGNEYKVTYSVTGAPAGYTVPAEQTVAVGTEVTVEAVPSITGYDFAGWTTTDATVADGKFTMPDNAVTFTGTFTVKKYDVIYYTDTDKATVLDTQNKDYNTEVTVGLSTGKDEPAKAGYTFKGWTTTDVTVADGKFTMPASNVEFVPVWELNEYKVTYSVTGAPAGYTAPAEQTVAVGTEVTVEAVPSITGYDFAGWTTTDATVADGKFTMPDNAVTFTGTFTVKKYDVIYYTDTDKATVLDTQNKDYNTEVTVGLSTGKDEPAKTGYNFKGWTTTDATVADGKFTMPASNVEFVPVWEENVYEVVYNSNSPTGDESDVTDVPNKVELTYTQLNAGYTLGGAPKCDTYNFLGWSKTADGAAITSVNYSDLSAGSNTINVYALWEKAIVSAEVVYHSGFTKEYKFDSDGEYIHSVDDISVPYEVLDNTWFVREGYTFNGWVVSNPNGKVSTFSRLANFFSLTNVGDEVQPGDTVTLNGDMNLSANWLANQYNVKYDKNTTDDVASMPADESNLTVADDFSLNSAKDAYLHNLSTKVPTRDGYEFVGWSLTAGSTDCIKSVKTTDFTTDTITVYAVWNVLKYNVVYDGNNATEGTAPVDSNEYISGDTATVMDKGDLKRGDYTFKEWNTSRKGDGTSYQPGNSITIADSDVTLYAIWTDAEGNIVSPGTGENMFGINMAILAIIISAAAGAAVIYVSKRKMFA